MAITDKEENFFKDKAVLAAVFCSLLLNLSIWLILVFKLKRGELPIILHYNVYFGVDYLGRYSEAFAIPASGLIMLAANSILGNCLYKKSKAISKILIFSSIIIQLLLLIAAITIAAFNF